MAIINGTNGNDTLVGTLERDTINGGAGDDFLSDGNTYDELTDTYSGGDKDLLNGGKGDDLYRVVWNIFNGASDNIKDESGNDTVELYSASVDTGDVYFNIELGKSRLAGIENLIILGTSYTSKAANPALFFPGFFGFNVIGSTSANLITGSNLNDTLTGGAGDDTLDGGISGVDLLIGGTGNDVFILRDGYSDTIEEKAKGGIDTVEVDNVDIDLTELSDGHIENATFSASTSAISVLGNSTNNVLILRSNLLAVQLDGGLGNDVYQLGLPDEVTTLTSELISISDTGGIDKVISYLSEITLGANIEELVLGTVITDSSTTYALAGIGNELNNKLTGNAGNNSLDGGLGRDTMIGGAGNDTYYVDDLKDVITELSGQGEDTVISSVSFNLGKVLEHLTLIGDSNINGTGNGFNNMIFGNAGKNIITGAAGDDSIDGGAANDKLDGGVGNDALIGGTGNDLLKGGTGDDIFVFGDGSGFDIISDFTYKTKVVRGEVQVLEEDRLYITGHDFNDDGIFNGDDFKVSMAADDSGALVTFNDGGYVWLKGVDEDQLDELYWVREDDEGGVYLSLAPIPSP